MSAAAAETRSQDEADERASILDTLARLTDRTMRADVVKFQLEQLHQALSAKLKTGAPHIFESVGVGLKLCGLSLSYKAPLYATLAGLLTVGNEPYALDMANKLSDAVGKDLAAAIRDGRSSEARRALRFLVCLASSSMVSPASVAEYVLILLDTALVELTSANRSPYGVHCRGEFLADIALSCLPWIGPLLAERSPNDLEKMNERISSVAEAWQPRRWRCVASATEDRCIECFSELIAAVVKFKDRNWTCSEAFLPSPYKEFEIQLGGGHEVVLQKLVIPSHSKLTRYSAPRFRLFLVNPPSRSRAEESSRNDSDSADRINQSTTPADTSDVQMSETPTGTEKGEPMDADSAVKNETDVVKDANMSDAFTNPSEASNGLDNKDNRGSTDELNPAEQSEPHQDTPGGEASNSEGNTDGSGKQAERTTIEDYVLRLYVADIVDNFSTNHGMAAERLLTMPLLNNVNDEIVEGLFSQMCAMPLPSFAPVYYGTLFVDLCRVKDSRLPTKLLIAVETMFQNSNQFDPESFDRLTNWFSFHLSNFGYKWNWSDWALYADQDMVDKFPFRALFCKDILAHCVRLSYYDRILKVIPTEMKYFLPPQPGNGNQARFESAINDELMSVVTGKGKQEADVVKKKLATLIPDPTDIEDAEEMKKACEQANLSRLSALIRSILLAGCKTLSHFDTVAERYLALLLEMSLAGGVAARGLVTLEVNSFWSDVHIRRMYVLDKLSTHRVIDGLAIIDYALSSDRIEGTNIIAMTPEELADSLSQSSNWEVIRLVMSRACAREEGARFELTAASQAAAAANEGEIETAEVRLERAKSGTESAKREISELLLLAFRRLFGHCAWLIEKNADDMEQICSTLEPGRGLPGFGRGPIWYWRCLGMIRELARKHPRHLTWLMGPLELDTAVMREQHAPLAESFLIIKEVEASALLPQVW